MISIGLGVTSIGHRRKLLAAISAMREAPTPEGAPPAERTPSPAISPSMPTDPAAAERRQLTIMFCDVVGSTELATRLDPEDLREIIAAYQRRVSEVLTRFAGFVAKYMGDGILAYFGYPQAHEEDAEQAVRAGLAIVDAVGNLDLPQRLEVRLGIATGLVVVGDLIGAGAAQEQSVVGETANLAARLQALAGPNDIVIGEATRRQIGEPVRIPGSRAAVAKGLWRDAAGLAGARRKQCRQPLRGAALASDAADWPRRGNRVAAAPLDPGQGRRGARRAALGRAGNRQVAADRGGAGAYRQRAASAVALFLLAASPRKRPLSDHRPTRTRRRLRP